MGVIRDLSFLLERADNKCNRTTAMPVLRGQLSCKRLQPRLRHVSCPTISHFYFITSTDLIYYRSWPIDFVNYLDRKNKMVGACKYSMYKRGVVEEARHCEARSATLAKIFFRETGSRSPRDIIILINALTRINCPPLSFRIPPRFDC